MSLDEAIRYYSHLADENRRKADIERNDYMDLKDLTAECEQLADWLNELKVLREKIQKLLKKQEQDGWIPVTERLPEYGTEVLTQLSDNDIVTNWVIDEEDEEWFEDDVIAWRPLPELFQEEEL